MDRGGKAFRIFFWTFAFVLFCFTALRYEGHWYVYGVFSAAFNLLLWMGLREGRIFFDTFMGILYWLGFWLKLSVRVAFLGGSFHEPTGFFDFTAQSFDHALLVSTCGAVALIVVSWLRERYFYTYSQSDFGTPLASLLSVYERHRRLVLGGFSFFVLVVAAVNFGFGFYQRGSVPQTVLPFGLNAVFVWLVLFGMASFSAFLLDFEFRVGGKKSFSVVLLSLGECFLSSTSMLSRGMVLNGTSLLLGLRECLLKVGKLNGKFWLKTLLVFGVLFFLSVFMVNFIRSYTFAGKEVGQIKIGSVANVASGAKVLFIDRWVGIEGVMAVSSYPGRGWGLWKEAWNEKFKNSGTSLYDLKIIESYVGHDLSEHHFVSLPGLLAFLFYPGSFWFLFFSMLLMGGLGATIDFFVYKVGQNPVLCSLLAQVVAYRYAHFGYAPGHSYVLFAAIFLNLSLIYLGDNACRIFWADSGR